MNFTRSAVALTIAVMVAGCSSTGHGGRLKPVPVSAEQRLALARAGQSVVFEGYVYNGVVVTPARNYYYGQTDGYRSSEVVQGDCFISEISEAEGGEIDPDCPRKPAPEVVVARVAPEQEKPKPAAPMSFYDRILAAYAQVGAAGQQPLSDRKVSFAQAPVMHFEAGKTDLKNEDQKLLGSFATVLNGAGGPVIVNVNGYTSEEGPAAFNDELAIGRARTVRTELGSLGVGSDFLLAFGAGQCCYLNNNRTPLERAANRRVELTPGGRFSSTGSLVPEAIAVAIAQAKHAVDGSPNASVRVHVQASSQTLAENVMRDIRAAMQSQSIGMKGIAEGALSFGNNDNVIIEVTP